MRITQGVLKYCKIFNVKFEDKYANIKTIKSTENYDSKFSGNTSQTSTILSTNNSYYNIVEHSNILSGRTLFNCSVENGKFFDSTFLSLNNDNFINDGYFSGCTFSGYTINGGQFFDCVINSGCTWKNGQWNGAGNNFKTIWTTGVWNSGVFPYPVWSGGTFNGGTFKAPSVWITGVANGGLFSGITWNHGLVRDGYFLGCTFKSGTFNNGTFSGGTFSGGTFNNGQMSNATISGGTFNNGTISNCIVRGNTKIDGGNFSDTNIYNGEIYNMNATNLIVNYGKFYNGTYDTSTFITGDIYNGLYLNLSGTTSGLTIHNGTFKSSSLWFTNIHNGNFTNCNSYNVKWDYGVYTEGEMKFNLVGSYWNDGYWNDGIFTANNPFEIVKSNELIIGDPPTPPTPTICVQFSEGIGWDYYAPLTACSSTPDIYYGDNIDFSLSTKISASSACTVTVAGYFSNGTIWRYSPDGMTFTANGTCSISPSNFWYILSSCDTFDYFYAGPFSGTQEFGLGYRVEGSTSAFYVVTGTRTTDPGTSIPGITWTPGQYGCPDII